MSPANHPIPVSVTPPEIELLFCCSRTHIDTDTTQRILQLVQGGIDWDFLMDAAIWHGVLPLVYQNLSTISSDGFPQSTRQQFQAQFLARTRETLFLTAELIRILNLLDAAGIPAIPYKGPVLAQAAYGNPTLRHYIDLDILLHKEDILKAKNLLLDHDFYPLNEMTAKEERDFLKSSSVYDYILMRSDNRFKIELHWGFARWYFPFALNPNSLWEHEQITIGGREIPNLLPEPLLLILTMHGAKHRWEQLKWICDVAEMVRTYQETIDWDRVIKQSRRLGCKRVLLLGLFLAHDLLCTPLPTPVMEQIQAEAEVMEELKIMVRKVLFSETYGKLKDRERYSFYLKMRERPLDRLRYFYYLSQRMTPNQKDEVVRLPKALSFLYYIIRPARLLAEYGASSVKELLGL